MSKIRVVTGESTTVIEASVNEVWELIVDRFDEIGAWSSGVKRSEGVSPTIDGIVVEGAGERSCQIAAPGFSDTKERVIEVVPKTTLRYELYDGLPGFVAYAENSWTITPVANGTRLTGRTDMHISGPIGAIAGSMMRRNTIKALDSMTSEAKYFIENGEPHPKKAKQLAKHNKTKVAA